MNEECLICKAPLEYLETDVLMECAICHKKEYSKTRCIHGHYVCNECHTAGMDSILSVCLNETSKDPVEIIEKMMALPFCHMHGPEHHVMVGAALLTAYRNAGGQIDLPSALSEMMNRGKKIPGGACGFWGACGAGISSGMFVSIISGSTPLSQEPFALSHKMTAKSLDAIAETGGPRCCKRDSYLSLLSAIDFVKKQFGIQMERPQIICTHSAENNQCIGKRCPFSRARFSGESLREKMIRTAELNDVSRIAEILVFVKRMKYRRIFHNDAFSFGELQVLPVAKQYESPEILNHILVYDDGIVKGMIHIEGSEIAELYVDVFFHNQGVGSALIEYARMHYPVRFLWTLEKNTEAIHFYEKHGFHLTSTRKPEEGTPEYLVRMEIDEPS